jgi:probable phosphoglycerate mutase
VSDRLWLLRHGDTDWTEHELHTGRADPALSDAGRHQAGRAGALLAGRPFDRVLVSPQRRARETCELAGYGELAETRESLVEWDYGAVEGMSDAETEVQDPDWDLFRDGAPGGESVRQITARVDTVLSEIGALDGRILIVGHGKFLRALAARWVGAEIALGAALPLDPAAICVLEREDGQPLLRAWNYLDRLPESSR